MKYDTEINKRRLLRALEKHRGIVTHACREVNMSREFFYRCCKDDPSFKAKVDEINETVIDFVENKLFEKIDTGSEKSIHFYLRFKGKGRGYTDSLDITSAGESITDVEIRIVRDDPSVDDDDDNLDD